MSQRSSTALQLFRVATITAANLYRITVTDPWYKVAGGELAGAHSRQPEQQRGRTFRARGAQGEGERGPHPEADREDELCVGRRARGFEWTGERIVCGAHGAVSKSVVADGAEETSRLTACACSRSEAPYSTSPTRARKKTP